MQNSYKNFLAKDQDTLIEQSICKSQKYSNMQDQLFYTKIKLIMVAIDVRNVQFFYFQRQVNTKLSILTCFNNISRKLQLL